MGVNQNDELTSYLAGKVYVAPTPASIPAYVIGSNEATIEAYIEANVSFTRLWGVNGLEIVKDFTAQVASIKGDECDYIESKYSKPLITINQDWLENIDVDAISIITGLPSQNVANTLVPGATQVIANPFTPNLFVPITNQNGDGSIITINSVTGGTDGALTADDDYSLVLKDGIYGIVMNTVAGGFNLTTLAQTITIDYDYTPNATKYTGIKSNNIQLPQLVVKIVGCPNANSKFNTHYLVNASISGTITQGFVDLSVAGSPVPSPISFVSNFGGYMIDKVNRGVS